MTAVEHEARLHPALLAFLEEHAIRHEVLGGLLIVHPLATFAEADLAVTVLAQLRLALPPELAVLGSNFGYFYDPPSWVCPDITVARRADCVREGTYAPPLIVVEALSPSNGRRDLLGKRTLYAAAGVPQYWIIDPDEPRLTVLTLTDGTYVQTATVAGREGAVRRRAVRGHDPAATLTGVALGRSGRLGTLRRGRARRTECRIAVTGSADDQRSEA